MSLDALDRHAEWLAVVRSMPGQRDFGRVLVRNAVLPIPIADIISHARLFGVFTPFSPEARHQLTQAILWAPFLQYFPGLSDASCHAGCVHHVMDSVDKCVIPGSWLTPPPGVPPRLAVKVQGSITWVPRFLPCVFAPAGAIWQYTPLTPNPYAGQWSIVPVQSVIPAPVDYYGAQLLLHFEAAAAGLTTVM